MAEVVDATKQEDGARMMGRYLLQAVEHAFGVVANDAIVDHVLRVQSGVRASRWSGLSRQDGHQTRPHVAGSVGWVERFFPALVCHKR